jgi:hypothetical protein
MLDGIIKGRAAKPRRVLLYGTHGIGKSTWASQAPSPIFLTTEDGLDDVGIDRTPLLTETMDVAKWLVELSGPADHGYKTVVVDTLDWLEKMILAATCKEAGKKSIEEFGYGKGYVLANRRWEQLLHMLDACRVKGMNVILLAHARIEKFSPPENDPYDRWVPDIHKLVAPTIQEWCDEVLFATYRVNTSKRDEGFGQKRTRAIGGGERVVHTCETPTHNAKRRVEMPDEISLDWREYQSYWPTNGAAKGNIDGMVIEGSSKKKGSN